MKWTWLGGALLGLTVLGGVSMSSKPAAAQATCTSGGYTQPLFTDSNGNTCCPSQLVGSPSGGSMCPITTPQASSSNRVTAATVGTATGGASIRAARAFIDALGDRYEGGNLQESFTSSSTPTSGPALAYAPLDSFEARYPVIKAPPPPAAKPYRFFVTTFGGGFSDNQVFAQHGSYYGGLIGVDYRVNNNLLIGASVGGSSSDVSLASAYGSTTGVNGAIFAIGTAGSFYAQSLTTLSGFSNDTVRAVATGGAAVAIERSSYGSTEIRTRAEFGRVVDLGDIAGFPKAKITPFVAMEIAQLHQDGHSETNTNGVPGGAALGLNFAGQDMTDVPAFIGARLEASYNLGNGMVFTPIIRLAYVHQFANSEASAATFLGTTTTTFAQNGTLLGRNSAQTKAGFELNLGRGVVVFTNFEGLFSANDSLYGGRGGVRVSF